MEWACEEMCVSEGEGEGEGDRDKQGLVGDGGGVGKGSSYPSLNDPAIPTQH